ncbi:hypothetical protein AB0E69_35060 [Kribbella sp. NPDC026611]|uniref:hypothetical protein n=1 Tax=Kribbella sp. NPDC026611 TaxID=3154911 RepID=UPI00340F3C50
MAEALRNLGSRLEALDTLRQVLAEDVGAPEFRPAFGAEQLAHQVLAAERLADRVAHRLHDSAVPLGAPLPERPPLGVAEVGVSPSQDRVADQQLAEELVRELLGKVVPV